MHSTHISDLEQFLHGLPRSGGSANCSLEDADELRGITARPPAGLVLYKFGSRSVVGGYVLRSGTEAALKYYFPRNPFRQLAYGLGRSRCERSWVAAHAYEFAGIPTSQPLFIREHRHWAGLGMRQAFLATRQAPGISLRELVDRCPEDRARFLGIARQLKHAFAQMARYRMVHGDLKATNIIVDDSKDDAIAFIDLDGAQILMPPNQWNAAKEKDRRRFRKNWQNFPVAAECFHDVFSGS